MGSLVKGYYVVCLSLIISWATFFSVPLFFGIALDWFHQTVLFALLQVLVICIQVLGLAFCFVGIRKSEQIHSNVLIDIFLILWGGFTIVLALGFYGNLLDWGRLPQVRSLTMWDHLQYAVWAFKGLMWVLAGTIFTVMKLTKKQSAHAS